jgi:hypothetical protein
MKAVLVGEAWGDREERFKHALVGPSGKELARMLAQAGFTPPLPELSAEGTELYLNEMDMIRHWAMLHSDYGIAVTNVFNTHPPNNDIEWFFTKERNSLLPPLKAARYIKPDNMHHLIRLWDELRSLRPNLIVAMGNSACWATLGQVKIGTLRGTIQTSSMPAIEGMKVLPIYHPAAILRQWSLRPTTVADLTKAKREAEFPDVRRVDRFITVAESIDEIQEWLRRPATAYACDIETYRGQITMIAFARSRSDAICIQFVDPVWMQNAEAGLAQNMQPNWWPSAELETHARFLTQELLVRRVPKIFQNGLYDLQYLLCEGFRPTMCLHDTMLHHHALYPELPKSLGFLGSVYCSEIAWKQLRRAGGDTLKRDE